MENFEFIDNIDEGAFGIVQKARNKETGEIVAIKKIKRKFTSWSECMNLREVKSLRKLKHPNIIKLKEVFKEDNTLYMVFEYADNDLFKLYSNKYKNAGVPMPESEIRTLIFQITKGLAFMHKNGYFHRDLKPENILVTSEGIVKVADLGLAREIRSSPPYTDYVSTRWYRSPEILLKSSTYNSPVDIFSLGCIMAELYLQQPLFNGNSEIDQLQKICKVLGTPTKSWAEGHKLSAQMGFEFPTHDAVPLKDIITNASPKALDLLASMLKFDNSKRITAAKMLNHPYFACCSNEDTVNTAEQVVLKPKATVQLEFQSRNAKAPSKSQDSWSDDLDLLINDKNQLNNNKNIYKTDSLELPYSYSKPQAVGRKNDYSRTDGLAYDSKNNFDIYPDSLYGLSNEYKYKTQGLTPKLKTDAEASSQFYMSPKAEIVLSNHKRELSNTMKLNSHAILDNTMTPKKDPSIYSHISKTIEKSMNSRFNSEKDRKAESLSSKQPISNFSNKKPRFEDKIDSFNYDNFDPEPAKEKKPTDFKGNFNIIDDQIEKLLNAPLYKTQQVPKDSLETDNNPSIITQLLKRIPGDNKPALGGISRQDKENYKITHSRPSYLNGITMFQNFEKPGFK